MKTKIIAVALSGLALLSACDNSEDTASGTATAPNTSAPANAAPDKAKTAAPSPATSTAGPAADSKGSDIAEPNSDRTDLPESQDDEFNEEPGVYEEDGTIEAEPEEQTMEEDGGGE
ncbi:MAG: hypothetical protein Q7U57_15615 [Methylovulum sp.]|nr:hypothetical protein [Methylovulum sp.]